MEKDKKFIRCYFSMLIGMLLACVVVIVIIDPFSNYHKPICGLESVPFSQVHQNPGYAKNYDYDIAIIGTSMTEGIRASDVEKVFG